MHPPPDNRSENIGRPCIKQVLAALADLIPTSGDEHKLAVVVASGFHPTLQRFHRPFPEKELPNFPDLAGTLAANRVCPVIGNCLDSLGAVLKPDDFLFNDRLVIHDFLFKLSAFCPAAACIECEKKIRDLLPFFFVFDDFDKMLELLFAERGLFMHPRLGRVLDTAVNEVPEHREFIAVVDLNVIVQSAYRRALVVHIR